MTCSRCQLIYKQIINDPTKDLTDSRNYRYNSKYALSCLSLPNCNTDNFKYRYSYDKILPENSIGLYEKKGYSYLMLKNDQTYNEMTALNIFTDVEYFDVEKKIAIYPRFEASVLLIKHVLGQRSKKISNDMKDQMAQRSSSRSNEMHPDFSFLLDKTEKKFQVVKEIVENLPSLAEKREFDNLLATQKFLKGFINWSKSDYTTARKTFYQTYPPKLYRTELEKLWFDQEYTLWQSEIKEKYGIHPSKYKKLLSENIKNCVEFIWPDDRVLTTQEQIWKLVALISINLQETENEEAEKLARMVVRLSDEMHVIEFACMAMDCGEVDFKVWISFCLEGFVSCPDRTGRKKRHKYTLVTSIDQTDVKDQLDLTFVKFFVLVFLFLSHFQFIKHKLST